MLNILILSCGTNASFHIIKTLKEKFKNKFYIVGADTNDSWLVSSIHHVDKFYKVAPSSEKVFLEHIENIFKTEKIDYIIPSFDTDQFLFFNDSEILKKYSIKSLSTPKETLDFYKSKESMCNFLNKHKIKTPINYKPCECIDTQEYFVKPIRGVGSTGIAIKKGVDIKNIGNYVIQEICHGPEITMECFSFEDFFSCICRERIDTKAGVCVKARIFHDPELENIGKKFVKSVKTPYYFNLQFMKNSEEKYVITDVNLRSAGGMSLSYAAGWDVTSALAKIMLQEKKFDICKEFPAYIGEQYVVRAYTDIITRKKKVVAFDLDGTLLDSRCRHIKVLNDILEKRNIHIDTLNLIDFKRKGKNNISFLVEKGISIEIAQDIQNEWIENIENVKYLENDTLYANYLDLLFKYTDCEKILITARNNEENATHQIKALDLEQYFQKIFIVPSNSKTPHEKAKILDQTGACIFIGDTKSDYEAAKLAKIEFRHENHGFHSNSIIGN